MEELLVELQALETLNPCVCSAIGALAAMAEPERWYDLMADAKEVAGDMESPEAAALLNESIEYTEAARAQASVLAAP